MILDGSCRCGAVRFSVASRTPVPYQRCYCPVCRKTAGGGGYAINIGADAGSLRVTDPDEAIGTFRAGIRQEDGHCALSSGERRFCTRCGTALWLFSLEWPDLVHPFASAIDTDLPVPPTTVHMMLRFKAGWVIPQIGEGDPGFDTLPGQSLEDWHWAHGPWAE